MKLFISLNWVSIPGVSLLNYGYSEGIAIAEGKGFYLIHIQKSTVRSSLLNGDPPRLLILHLGHSERQDPILELSADLALVHLPR